jgi:extracellular factor (EF) 3-hydroxypalmitic acid methyl ester biosynthesis protein
MQMNQTISGRRENESLYSLEDRHDSAIHEADGLDELDAREARLRLAAAVRTFCDLRPSRGETNEALHHRVLTEVHAICARIVACEGAGLSRDEIVGMLGPVREIHARSPFVQRLQDWPRGYPGDFETVEYICSGRNRAKPGTIEAVCESYSLNLPIAQQHRNKVRHQASRILKTMMEKPRQSRIFTLACGSCPDFRQLQPLLEQYAGEIVLNDSDDAALSFVGPIFASVEERVRFVQGNALKVARRMEREKKFDLVLAGGLFDYLGDRHATYLIETIYHGLLADGGTFFFTNIARGNPYRSLIEHFGDWFLLERSEDDIRKLCVEAGVPKDAVQTRCDETGLAVLIEITP